MEYIVDVYQEKLPFLKQILNDTGGIEIQRCGKEGLFEVCILKGPCLTLFLVQRLLSEGVIQGYNVKQ